MEYEFKSEHGVVIKMASLTQPQRVRLKEINEQNPPVATTTYTDFLREKMKVVHLRADIIQMAMENTGTKAWIAKSAIDKLTLEDIDEILEIVIAMTFASKSDLLN